jgi:DNA-binding NtrC family response regulator
MANDATRASTMQWFVRGGTLTVQGMPPVKVGVQPVLIGRDGSCGVAVDDPEVSSIHCEVRAEGAGVLVKDQGSKNGTFVGAVRIREAVLAGPCTLTVGSTKIAFEPVEKKQRVDVGFDDTFGPLVGGAPRMRHLFRLLGDIAPTDLSMLINGETGCGKELVAQAVHDKSPRAKGPFVVVDCGSIPGPLAESLLFGHEKGAFTGANERRQGAFHEANKGTIFLDELGELPVELQPKLLRALSEKQVKRVGAQHYEAVDVRVVAATRRDLGQAMNAGRFRSDLFFRIAQVRVELPPLRERREDIPMLVRAVCKRIGKLEREADITELVTATLSQHDWPGNVRELVNVTSVAASLPMGAESVANLLPLERGELSGETFDFSTPYGDAKRSAINAFEAKYFGDLFKATGGNVSEMARKSGMERHHIRPFLRKLGLSKG